ncbi:MAG: M48 family metalloprotease [Deltaproteobacteria bacterium]|nr:MAG: M48 family metalloprotease [Deltaproteobacteria bacterium]
MILSFVVSFIGFWALSKIMNWQAFYDVFQAGDPAPHKALVLFGLFSGVFTFWLTPIFNGLSRKYEYEADKFSKEILGDAQPLATGLIKMCKENLSNLTPHPWYSFYHHSHPTTVERVDALKH